MAQIMVQYGKPSCSSWTESVRSSWAGQLWERQFVKVLSKYGLEKVPIWECFSLSEKKDCSYLCMWAISNWLARNRTWVQHGRYWWKTLIWENQHQTSNMFIWVALKENVRSARILWIVTEICSNQGFLPVLQKNCQKQKPQGNLMPKRYLHGPTIWKVMQRNAWKDISNLRIKQRINNTKSQRHAWMIINVKKNKMDQLENSPQFAHKLFWNVSIWHVLEGLIFHGLWTKLLVGVTKWTKCCDERFGSFDLLVLSCG